jgi:hypothetical protein
MTTILLSAMFAETRQGIQRGSLKKTGSFAQDWKSSSVENAGRSERSQRARILIARLMYVTTLGLRRLLGETSDVLLL